MSRLTDEPHPDCGWVFEGEGVATRKWDGTCVVLVEPESMMSVISMWWARREVKPGKTAPENFVAVAHDEATGKTVGWEPIEQSPFAKYHAEAVVAQADEPDGYATHLAAGTYELVGPKINRGPDVLGDRHLLIRHGAHPVDLFHINGHPATPRGLIEFCREEGWEGIVWHHPDGRMAKLKVRDYA